ncbi:MAG: SLBB domain-containing protein [Gemmataceae bacterium]
MAKIGWSGLWLMAMSGALTGCSSFSNNLGLFPDGYRLTEAAKAIRQSTPPPLELPRELDKQVSGPYIVEPGDVLLVQPASLDSPVRLPGDQPVLADGTIQLGKYGRYLAAGKPMEIIEREVNELIQRETADAGVILVRLVTRESKVFYVLGEVNAPGAFPLRGRETVLDALLAAGGLNSNANKRKILLSRPTSPDSCRVVLPVRFNDIVQLGDTTTNYQIRAGDRIYVPSRSLIDDFWHLLGKDKDSFTQPQVGCPTASSTVAPLVPSPAMKPTSRTPLVPMGPSNSSAPTLPAPNTSQPDNPTPPASSSTPPSTTSTRPGPLLPVGFQAPQPQTIPNQAALNTPPPPLSLPPVSTTGYRPTN